jgi:hypothetical protein
MKMKVWQIIADGQYARRRDEEASVVARHEKTNNSIYYARAATRAPVECLSEAFCGHLPHIPGFSLSGRSRHDMAGSTCLRECLIEVEVPWKPGLLEVLCDALHTRRLSVTCALAVRPVHQPVEEEHVTGMKSPLSSIS